MKRLVALLLTMLVILGVAVGGVGAAKTTSKKDASKYGGAFVWAQGGDPNTLLYPWLVSGWTNRMSCFINDKLFVIDNDGNITYRVCDRHAVSPDGLVYAFRIRDGVKWHDGTPVLASDICWTRNVMHSDDWFMALQFQLPGVWEAKDARTFTVTLEEPDPNFLYTVFDVMYPQPEHYYKGVKPSEFPYSYQATHPIGCGPFKFVEYKVGDYLKMEAFDDFWNGRPYLDYAYIKITGGGTYTEMAFEAGEISAVTTTETFYEEIKNDKRFSFLIGPSTMCAELNLPKEIAKYDDAGKKANIYTGDRVIREAMMYMIPYDDIINKILRGACTRSYSIVPSDAQWYTEKGINKYYYDIKKANKILDDAGYVDTDGDGIRNWSDGSNIAMKVCYYDVGGVNEAMCILFAEQLAKCGIGAVLSTSEQTTWVETFLDSTGKPPIEPGKIYTEIYLFYYGGGDALAYDYYNRYSTYGGQSDFIEWKTGERYPDEVLAKMFAPDVLENMKRVDEIFMQLKAVSPQEAEALFHEMQRIMMNDIIWSGPIGTMQRRIAFQRNIKGIEDALWFTNNNYLGFAMEKIYIEK